MNEFIRVDEWIKEIHEGKREYTEYIRPDGKLMIIEFDKLFKTEETPLNTFVIKKDSYANHSQFICDYINYFLNFYDIEKELIVSYYRLRYLIGNTNRKIKKDNFINLMYSLLFTDNMKDKISRMVEDNYYIDVTDPTQKYNPALEFTNEDAKILHKIGMSIKIMTPILFQYINSAGIVKSEKYLFPFYQQLFYMYSTERDVYEKLYLTVFTKVKVSSGINKKIYDQREMMGVTSMGVVDKLLKENIISETMFKYEFCNNIIAFNSVILNNQLKYFNIEPHAKNMIEVDHKPGSDGLSGLDKLEIGNSVYDESITILSDVAIPNTVARFKATMPIALPDEEIDFYIKNHQRSKFQIRLMFDFYAKYFHGYKNLRNLGERTHFELLILLKRRLQLQGDKYLPQILTGNVNSKLNTRTIQNSKFLEKIENSPLYQSIINDKYSYVEELDKGPILLNYISIMINNTFTYVDYDNPDSLAQEIEINQDILSDEFLKFAKQF